MLPNFRNWKQKQLKEIIAKHNDITIVYFDSQIKNNQQDLSFARIQLGTQKKQIKK
jgi:hypothetical protein